MTGEYTQTLSPKVLNKADPKAKAQVGQNRRLRMTEPTGEGHIDVSRQGQTESIKHVGVRYRFKRLALPIVLRDLYFNKGDPGPGDLVPTFDLPTVGGGRFRFNDSPRPASRC